MANSETVYVVQYQRPNQDWTDLGDPISVAPKTKRQAVIRQAFMEHGDDSVIKGAIQVRVLDEESARAHTVELVQRDPELRIR